ncbi:right-handed parallel beta-helix repeat-containing protein [Micromonospora inositola]|nr:right-handed parallel beta-helix repeat-containing protein [Micromonospora inositola]
MRSTTRDHPGALVLDSAEVTLSRMRFRFLHGFGVAAQTSRDVTVEGCQFQAPPDSGRHSAGFADFIPVLRLLGTSCRARLPLRRELPDGLVGWTAVENVTRTPTVQIVRNIFRNVPTRGVLVTSRRAVLIEENRFEHTGMASIYVSGDAAEWWESGPVRDVTIRGNEFVEPGGPAIHLDPRNTQCDQRRAVHSGVLVTENQFVLDGVPALDAKSTRGIRFRDNSIVQRGQETPDIILRSCFDVRIELDSAGRKRAPSGGLGEINA